MNVSPTRAAADAASPGALPATTPPTSGGSGVSVSLGYALAVAGAAAGAGGGDPALLDAAGGRLSFEQVRGVWDLALGEGADPGVGLRMGADLRPAALEVLGHLVLGSVSLGEAAEAAERYHRLVSEAGEIALVRGAALSRLVYRPVVAPQSMHPQQVEAVVAGMVSAARWLAGPGWAPAGVSFTHTCGGDEPLYVRVLGCPVAFGAPENALIVPTAELDRRRAVPDPGLTALQRRYADGLLADLIGAVTVADQVRRWLAAAPLDQVTPADVRAALCLGERALRRALREDGTSWRALLDEARHARARHLLESTDLTTDRIARAVGLSGAAALGHAFTRWQGTSPGAYRRSWRAGGV
ncbi:AraC family transcriptional regulator [Kitasatospora sp. NPDC094015]|uniref:AraC family transcriptional regulator n=1 Tax=Kitasatospora sp. NPDC094015 TaxID=3155205 RepID=UPI003319AC21